MSEIDMDLMRRVAESHQGAYGDACWEALRLSAELAGLTEALLKVDADTKIAALRAEVARLQRDLHYATCCPEPDNCHAAPQPEGSSDE